MKYVILSVLLIIIVIGVWLSVRILQGPTLDIQKVVNQSLNDTLSYGGNISDSIALDSTLIEHSKITPNTAWHRMDTILSMRNADGKPDTIILIARIGEAYDTFLIKMHITGNRKIKSK